MEFRYYYIVQGNSIVLNQIAHIKIWGKPTLFLCGAEKPDKYEIREWALPGRKLCPQCVLERDRLIDGRPTLHQVSTWWQGGQADHKKELEIRYEPLEIDDKQCEKRRLMILTNARLVV